MVCNGQHTAYIVQILLEKNMHTSRSLPLTGRCF